MLSCGASGRTRKGILEDAACTAPGPGAGVFLRYGMNGKPPTRADVAAALEAVNDPHVPASLRRMGMLREIEISGDGVVTVQLCIPCMGCPGTGLLRDAVRDAVMSLDGVTGVTVEEGWHLPWSREMVDPQVRNMMRANGIQV